MLVRIASPRAEPFAMPAEWDLDEVLTERQVAGELRVEVGVSEVVVGLFLIHSTSVSPAGIVTSAGSAGQSASFVLVS